jgi:hypothetical protein
VARDTRTFPILVLGILLLVVAGVFPSLDVTQLYLKRLLLLAGAGALVWAFLRSGPTLRFFLFRARTVSEPGPALNWLLLGLVLLVAALALGIQGVRIDLTARRMNSLSKTSIASLSQLSRDVELIGAYRDTSPLLPEVREILRIYDATSRKIKTRRFDPERDPEEARRLGIEQPNVLLVRSGEIRETVTDLQEAEITQAILRVEDPRRPTLAIMVGHGEMAPGRPGLNRFRKLVTDAGFVVRTLRQGELVEVPKDVFVLLIPGPQTPLLPGEVQAIERFLNRGGRLAVMIDPGRPTGLEDQLREHGIVVDGRRIRDESQLTRSLGLGPETIAVNRLGKHPVTEGLSTGIVFNGATSVALASKPIWGTNGTDLFRTGPKASFLEPEGEGRPGGGDPSARDATGSKRSQDERIPAGQPGVLTIGMALEWEVPPAPNSSSPSPVPEKPYARVVAVGDSDFLRDGTIDLYGNREVVSRMIGWLGEREFLLKFPPIDRAGTPLKLRLPGLKTVSYLVGLVLPLLVYSVGIFFWVKRR